MLGRVMDFKTLGQTPGFFRFKGFIKRGDLMSVEVINDKADFFGFRIVPIQKLFDFLCPVDTGSALSNTDFSPASKGFGKHKVRGRALAFIFIIVTFRLARFLRQCRTGFRDQLRRLLIHTNQGHLGIIGQTIQIQDVLHVSHKLRILLGRDYPAFSQMRLKFIFFRVWRTVSREMLSTISRLTNLSVKSCNVQRAKPLGGWLQPKAIRWASFLPSRILDREGVSCLFRSKAISNPSFTKRSRTLRTVFKWHPRDWAMSSSRRPRRRWSACNKIWACLILYAGLLPFWTNSPNIFRSCFVSFTIYFLFISILLGCIKTCRGIDLYHELLNPILKGY